MGLIKKTANFTMIALEGLKSFTAVEIEKKLSSGKIKDIKGSGDMESFGFCKIDDPFDFSTTYSNSVIGFGLRHDKKKISKGLFKKLYKAELRKILETSEKKKRLSKDEKQIAKEEVLHQMYSEAQPIEKISEVLLNFKDGTIFLGTTNSHEVDGFCNLFRQIFTESQLSVWNPEVIDPNTKGTKDNFQNALLTWILNKSVSEPVRGWTAQSAKFYDGISTITIKSDQELPTEAWFSSFKDRVVDSLSFCISHNGSEIDISLSRGSWSFRQVKFRPDLTHEDLESALFERYTSILSSFSQVEKLVKEFSSLRGTKEETDFWEQAHKDAMEKIKSEVKQ